MLFLQIKSDIPNYFEYQTKYFNKSVQEELKGSEVSDSQWVLSWPKLILLLTAL